MKRQPSSLSISNVSKRFGDVDAVVDASFAIDPGEIVGFVGPNGAGKTTTISLLLGLLRADKGSIRILGHLVTPETSHRTHRDIGFVAGDMVLPPSLTGDQYLRFMASRNGRSTDQYQRLLKQLSPILDRPLKELSRGNKQKIALIAALQHEPQILILDEPTSGLDPIMQDSFLSTIKKEAKRGVTVLMSSHILGEVSSVCSRIVFMKSGRLILDRPVKSILSKVGKHVILQSSEASRLAQFLPEGVELLSHSGKELKLSVPKQMLKPFLHWVTSKQFDDISIEERDLDDIFHELYIGKKGETL